MLKSKLILLLIIGILVSPSLVQAALPQDYMISYTYRNPDGTIFRIIKYYMHDGNKFRTEYRTPVQYNINNTEMQKEQLPIDIEPHTVEILRKDKKLVWSMDPPSKSYIEVPLRADSWEHAGAGIFVSDFLDYKKTGEIKILDYNCDIYQSVQKEEDSWTSILYAAQGLNLILKTEILQNGKLVQTMEATEFRTDKPDKSLFEIPKGYKKNDNNQ